MVDSNHGGQWSEEVVATGRSRLTAAESGIVRQPSKDEPQRRHEPIRGFGLPE